MDCMGWRRKEGGRRVGNSRGRVRFTLTQKKKLERKASKRILRGRITFIEGFYMHRCKKESKAHIRKLEEQIPACFSHTPLFLQTFREPPRSQARCWLLRT